jgi:(2Fe-2S) ferredoxin
MGRGHPPLGSEGRLKAVLRPWPANVPGRASVTVCINERKESFVPSCGRRGSREMLAALEAGLAQRGLDVDLQTIACLGLCDKGPNVRVAPSGSLYHAVAPDDVPALIDSLEREITAAGQ